MSQEILSFALLAIVMAAPLLLDRYLRQLPVAPACPSCNSVASQVEGACSLALLLPALAKTFLAECARCGWRGRMRWRWAPRAASTGDRRT